MKIPNSIEYLNAYIENRVIETKKAAVLIWKEHDQKSKSAHEKSEQIWDNYVIGTLQS